jgi:RNA polymerase sigma-70 factor (ECF subfamily)
MKTPRITSEEVGIIKRAQAGDESAFNTLFYKYKHFVETLLFQYVKDMDEAKDLTNVVFLKVYDKLSLFTAYESFGGWLRILTNRTAIDYLRETKNKNNILNDTDDRLPSIPDSISPEDGLVNRMTGEWLKAEFKKYPETTQRIFHLFYVKGLTVEQISKTLNVPTGTIKSTLSRTRRKIKKSLNLT